MGIGPIPEGLRRRVWKRDRARCVVCDAPGHDSHHLVPRNASRGGGHRLWNLAVICRRCHDLVHFATGEFIVRTYESLCERIDLLREIMRANRQDAPRLVSRFWGRRVRARDIFRRP